MTNNGTLIFNRSNAYSVGNAVSSQGTLVFSGSGATTFTVGTGFGAGGLATNGSGTFQSQILTMNPGAGPVTFSSLNQNGDGNNTVTYTTVFTNNSSSLLSVTGVVQNALGVGSLTIDLTGTGTGGVTLSGAIQNNGNNVGGRITALTINTTGAGVNAVTTLGGGSNNIFRGGTTLTSGILSFSAANSLGSDGSVVGAGALALGGAGATVNFNGFSQSAGAFSGNAGSLILNGSNGTNVVFTIGADNAGGGTYAGVIEDNAGGGATGTVALTKIGTATITLSGANTYSGATVIDLGTLTLNGAAGTLANTTSVTVNGGANFNLGDATPATAWQIV